MVLDVLEQVSIWVIFHVNRNTHALKVDRYVLGQLSNVRATSKCLQYSELRFDVGELGLVGESDRFTGKNLYCQSRSVSMRFYPLALLPDIGT